MRKGPILRKGLFSSWTIIRAHNINFPTQNLLEPLYYPWSEGKFKKRGNMSEYNRFKKLWDTVILKCVPSQGLLIKNRTPPHKERFGKIGELRYGYGYKGTDKISILQIKKKKKKKSPSCFFSFFSLEILFFTRTH